MKFRNIYKSEQDIADLKEAGKISAKILQQLKKSVKIGVTPKEINDLAGELCDKEGVEPSFLGVPGPKIDFPGNLCVCVNDETLHAIPFSERPFQSGDIVKLDFGIVYHGFATDHCITIGIGKLTKEEQKLINTAKLCVNEAVKEAVAGNKTGNISAKLQRVANLEGFNFVTNYASHGIGKINDGGLHMSPSIPSFGYQNTGVELVEGMTITVENQLSLGSSDLKLDDDGWTLRTVDGSKTAMFEHMVWVGKDRPVILTSLS